MALNKIGIDSINWLGDPKVVMISLIIYTIWVDVGYNVILFSAGIDGIPSYVCQSTCLFTVMICHLLPAKSQLMGTQEILP